MQTDMDINTEMHDLVATHRLLEINQYLHELLHEHCGAVVLHRTRDRGVAGSIRTITWCCVLEQDTLSTLLSTDFYPGRKRATWKISTRLLNALPSINQVDYCYYEAEELMREKISLG